MPRPIQYNVIMGNVNDVNNRLPQFAKDGWKPIQMSTTVNSNSPTSQVQVVILFELSEV